MNAGNMLSRVNLVTILLTLNCVSHAMEYSKSLQEKRQEDEERAVTSFSRKILRYMYNNVTSESLISSIDRIARDTLAEMHVQDVDAQPRSEVEERGN